LPGDKVILFNKVGLLPVKMTWKYSVEQYQVLVYKLFPVPAEGWFGVVGCILAICASQSGAGLYLLEGIVYPVSKRLAPMLSSLAGKAPSPVVSLDTLQVIGSSEAPAQTASGGLAGLGEVATQVFWFLLSSSCLPAPDRLNSTASQHLLNHLCI